MTLPRLHDMIERLRFIKDNKPYFRIFNGSSEEPSIFVTIAEADNPNKDEPEKNFGSPIIKRFLECSHQQVFLRDHIVLMAVFADFVDNMSQIALDNDLDDIEQKRFMNSVLIPQIQWLKNLWINLFGPLIRAVYEALDNRRRYSALVAGCSKTAPKTWVHFPRLLIERETWRNSRGELRFLFTMRNIFDHVLVDVFRAGDKLRLRKDDLEQWDTNIMKESIHKWYYNVFVKKHDEVVPTYIVRMRNDFHKSIPDFLVLRLCFLKRSNTSFIAHTQLGHDFKEKAMRESMNRVHIDKSFDLEKTIVGSALLDSRVDPFTEDNMVGLNLSDAFNAASNNAGGRRRVTKTYNMLKDDEMCLHCSICAQVYTFTMESTMDDNGTKSFIRDIYHQLVFLSGNKRIIDNGWRYPMACFKKVNAFRQMKIHYSVHGKTMCKDLPPLFRRGNARTAARAASKKLLKIYIERESSDCGYESTDSETDTKYWKKP